MDIKEAREFFYNMIEDLDENFPEFFGTKIFCDTECCNWLYDYYRISVESGCDKIAFVPVGDNLNYVLKVNINGYDSCYDELKIYELAKQEGVDFCLAAAYEGFVYNGRHFILMECVIPDEDEVYNLSKGTEEYDEEDDDYYDRDSCDCCWDAFCEVYGKYMEPVFNFFNKYEVTDLHTANCGWNDNGELVFFDYSGYKVERPYFHAEAV